MKKLVIAIVLGWIMVFALHFDLFSSMSYLLQDKFTTQTRPVDTRIKIVAIDDESINKEGKFPWPRGKIAELVDKVASDGAKGVWLDVPMTEKTIEKEDQALIQIVQKYDQVYLPIYFNFQVLQKSRNEIEQEYMRVPIVEIPEERLGHANLLVDSDQVLRRALLGIPTLEEEIMPLIDVRLANLLLPKESQISWDQEYIWRQGQVNIPIDESLQIGFPYATSPVDSKFDIIPAWKVIQGELDSSYFKDSVVLIGPYTASMQDQFITPISKERMHGVEIHANIIQSFIDKSYYSPISKATALIIVVVITMAGYLLFDWLKPRKGALLLAFLMIGYSLIYYYVFHSYGILIPHFYTLLGLIFAYITAIGEGYLTLRRPKHN